MSLLKQTLGMRAWALTNVFLLYFVKPTIVELNGERCVVKIPLNWRTKNHLKSMYFGALCIGADVAGGLMAFEEVRKKGARITFVFKDITAKFLKRPEGDVYFTNADGAKVQALVDRALASGEREETTVHVTATVPSISNEPVAEFDLTLSIKRR
jgi:acyl-coenzyme A thioesterase PaaI-like protein